MSFDIEIQTAISKQTLMIEKKQKMLQNPRIKAKNLNEKIF